MSGELFWIGLLFALALVLQAGGWVLAWLDHGQQPEEEGE